MARMLSCGWEWGTAKEFERPSTGNATVQSTIVRTGTYALQATGYQLSDIGFLGATGTHYWARMYFRISALPTTTSAIMFCGVRSTVNGGAAMLTTTGKIQAATAAAGVYTTFGSDSAATIAVGTWYRLEQHFMVNAAAGADDTVEVLLDGVSVASSTTKTIGTAAPNVCEVGWCTNPTNTPDIYIDDFALNNGASNDWPGPGSLVLLKPVSDNARVGWTAGGGATTSLFDAVNNTPPVGVAAATNTSQIARTVANTTDTYDANLTSYTTAGIGASDTINVVNLVWNHGHAGTTAHTMGYQMLSNPVIAEVTGTSVGSAAGTHPTNWFWTYDPAVATSGPGVATAPSVTRGTSPVMRVRKGTSDATNASFVDAMGAYVDYTPAVAVNPPRTQTVVQQAVQRAANW